MEYQSKNIWEEPIEIGDVYRRNYLEGINNYIERKNSECKNIRRAYMSPEDMKKNQEAYRTEFMKMIGITDLLANKDVQVHMEYVGSDDVCKVHRLVVYVTPEIPFYSLVLIPHDVQEPMPLMIAQHGGGGTPELCSDMYGKNNYKHMVQRALARGMAVLAPQLLLWSREELETQRAHAIPFDRRQLDVNFKRFGESITAMELCGIIRSLDYVSNLEAIDEERISMIGLSYGGYYTLFTTALDKRIKGAYVAGVFNDRDKYNWPDWCYKSSALLFQDAEVAALCAPRKLYVQVGKEDPVFTYETAIPEVERIKDYFEVYSAADNFRFSLWEGGHTISEDDEGYDFVTV